MRAPECVICGGTDAVRVGVVEWAEPLNGEVWTSLPRCEDRQACRDRLEATGETYPLKDRTTSRSKPMAVPAAPAADAGGTTWFD